ncbi:uncharacterized protein NEMAJ01_1652 [Nematocida major]|uniref:uncharacterized protein n=1 Tax=Nematocida major TaxID=1912982 RepID=UPI002008B139|nr:uncharacterized protein NEMAJ01_1652 [Nematocida major]KAH9386756.1 hypothetical protein NEMAJ01_1652 [Nematocida major]
MKIKKIAVCLTATTMCLKVCVHASRENFTGDYDKDFPGLPLCAKVSMREIIEKTVDASMRNTGPGQAPVRVQHEIPRPEPLLSETQSNHEKCAQPEKASFFQEFQRPMPVQETGKKSGKLEPAQQERTAITCEDTGYSSSDESIEERDPYSVPKKEVLELISDNLESSRKTLLVCKELMKKLESRTKCARKDNLSQRIMLGHAVLLSLQDTAHALQQETANSSEAPYMQTLAGMAKHFFMAYELEHSKQALCLLVGLDLSGRKDENLPDTVHVRFLVLCCGFEAGCLKLQKHITELNSFHTNFKKAQQEMKKTLLEISQCETVDKMDIVYKFKEMGLNVSSACTGSAVDSEKVPPKKRKKLRACAQTGF